MKPVIEKSHKMTTVNECLEYAIANGFTEIFKPVGRWLTTEENETVYNPADVSIVNFYRFEGVSDPEDNSILYLIETRDGKKGTLIDAYGAYADAKISEFVKQVDGIQKQKG